MLHFSRFPLGSRLQATHYIQQFSEIFTEEGRKSVKITHLVPGRQPRVSCTAGMRERDAKAQAQAKALARSTLAAVTSTTNPPNVRSPTVPCNQINSNNVNNLVNNSSELASVPNSNPSTNSVSATSNVNLVNALTSPPMSNSFTNILNSTLTGGLSPAVSSPQTVVGSLLQFSIVFYCLLLLHGVFRFPGSASGSNH